MLISPVEMDEDEMEPETGYWCVLIVMGTFVMF